MPVKLTREISLFSVSMSKLTLLVEETIFYTKCFQMYRLIHQIRNDPDPTKDFTPDYEKILCACALSVGRILGSVCHDHPLHPDAISLGEESKKFYQVNNLILLFISSS
jgi:hypothetical protein